MNWSPEIDKIVIAFVAALSELDNVTKGNKADMGTHSYRYADLSTVLDTVKPTLAAHQLAVSQPVDEAGVTTIVFHDSGQWLSFGPLQIKPTTNTPQSVGSAITYARRYQLLAALNLATEDDDGARASVTPTAHPNAGRIAALRHDWEKLDDNQKTAGHKFASDQGFTMTPKALETETHLEQMESWVDEQLHGTPTTEEGE